MKKTEKVLRMAETLVEVTCDLCGRSTRIEGLEEWAAPFSYGTLTFSGGWGSTHDFEKVHMELCETCLFDIVKRRVSGIYRSEGFDVPCGAEPGDYIAECFADVSQKPEETG